MNIIEHIAKTRLPLGEEGRQLFIPKICTTCKFFTGNKALLCPVNPTACKGEDSYCPQWESKFKGDELLIPASEPLISVEEIISVFPLEPTGYRIIWYGENNDEIFWDYRTFATISDAISGGIDALQRYWQSSSFEGSYLIEQHPEPLITNVCDEIYRNWLICTTWEESIELIDGKTNQVHKLPWQDGKTYKEDIDYAKDWIDQLIRDRLPPHPGQLSLFD